MMEWNVYYHNVNKDKIETYNILEHGSFIEDVLNDLNECRHKDDFAEFKRRLQRELRYYFWSKAQWEILLKPWVGSRNKEEVKIDVYDQVMLNFDIFADYVWRN